MTCLFFFDFEPQVGVFPIFHSCNTKLLSQMFNDAFKISFFREDDEGGVVFNEDRTGLDIFVVDRGFENLQKSTPQRLFKL